MIENTKSESKDNSSGPIPLFKPNLDPSSRIWYRIRIPANV